MNNEPVPPTPQSTNTQSGDKKMIILAIVLVLIIVILGILIFRHSKNNNSTSQSRLTPALVSITSTGFDPGTITIKPGQAVDWTDNDSAAHQVAADPYPNDNGIPGFNSKVVLLQGDSYSFVFNKKGTYHYHDQLNPSKFTGMVEVQ